MPTGDFPWQGEVYDKPITKYASTSGYDMTKELAYFILYPTYMTEDEITIYDVIINEKLDYGRRIYSKSEYGITSHILFLYVENSPSYIFELGKYIGAVGNILRIVIVNNYPVKNEKIEFTDFTLHIPGVESISNIKKGDLKSSIIRYITGDFIN